MLHWTEKEQNKMNMIVLAIRLRSVHLKSAVSRSSIIKQHSDTLCILKLFKWSITLRIFNEVKMSLILKTVQFCDEAFSC